MDHRRPSLSVHGSAPSYMLCIAMVVGPGNAYHRMCHPSCFDMNTHLVWCTCRRCSGDFSQVKQSKYLMSLPGLTETAISQLMDDITEAERAVAAQPGMYGRIWYGQGLAFDEAYQILQDIAACLLLTSSIAVRLLHWASLVCILSVHTTWQPCVRIGVVGAQRS